MLAVGLLVCLFDWARWDDPKSKAGANRGIAGTVRTGWGDADERALNMFASEAINGVTLLGVKV